MKLALAPMATLSHEALQLLIHRWGDPDEYFSEMIHAPSFVAGGQFEPWYARTAPVPERMVWQLTGNSAPPMAKAARLLLPLGGIGVDLNMGCSAPDIARHGAGIAWMSKPLPEVAGLIREIRRVCDGISSAADAAVDSAPLPGRFRLSVKLRLGETEDYARLLGFCRMLVDEGVDLVTLHPRTRREKYGRPARWEYVARLADDLPVPVYGNGDVDSAEKARDFLVRYPCAGLMIGRATVRTPWIFAAIRGATPESIDHLEVSRFFLMALTRCQPPEFQISRARRFFYYYCDNFSFAHHIKMRIQNAKTPDEIEGLLDEYFNQVPQDRCLTSREIASENSQG